MSAMRYQIEGRADAGVPWVRYLVIFTEVEQAQHALDHLREGAREGWPEYRIVDVASDAEPS